MVNKFPDSIGIRWFRLAFKPVLHRLKQDWSSFQMQFHQCWFFGFLDTLAYLCLSIQPYRATSTTILCPFHPFL